MTRRYGQYSKGQFFISTGNSTNRQKKDEELSKLLVFFSLQMSIDELTASHHELKPYGFMI